MIKSIYADNIILTRVNVLKNIMLSVKIILTLFTVCFYLFNSQFSIFKGFCGTSLPLHLICKDVMRGRRLNILLDNQKQ